MVPEEGHFIGDLIQNLRGDSERGSGGERASSRLDQLDDSVLQNFAVHLERRNLWHLSHGFKNRICNAADAGLQRHEAFGYPVRAHIGAKELSNMVTDRYAFRMV